MENSELLRKALINSLMAQHPEPVADGAIDLWERLAAHIISIIGEAGFNSLYARSAFLTNSTFPWLVAGTLSQQTKHRFEQLEASLKRQTAAQANEANTLLLVNFVNILATLIGEPLTTSILRAAWNNDVADSADKEFKHE